MLHKLYPTLPMRKSIDYRRLWDVVLSNNRILKFGEHKIIHSGKHRETYIWILTGGKYELLKLIIKGKVKDRKAWKEVILMDEDPLMGRTSNGRGI